MASYITACTIPYMTGMSHEAINGCWLCGGGCTEVQEVHYIQSGGVRVQIDGLLQTLKGASISGGVKDSTKLLECSL